MRRLCRSKGQIVLAINEGKNNRVAAYRIDKSGRYDDAGRGLLLHAGDSRPL